MASGVNLVEPMRSATDELARGSAPVRAPSSPLQPRLHRQQAGGATPRRHSDERPPRGTGDVPNGCGSAVLARQHDDCGPGQAIRRGPGGSAASKRRTVRREGFDILCYCRNVSLVTNSGARTISVTRRVLRRPNTKPVTVAQTSKR